MKFTDYLSLQGIAYGFFIFFFAIFVGKFGISDLILESITKWHIVFNIGAWFVLIMFCINGFSDSAELSKRKRLARE